MRATFVFEIMPGEWLSANSRPRSPYDRADRTRKLRTKARLYGLKLMRESQGAARVTCKDNSGNVIAMFEDGDGHLAGGPLFHADRPAYYTAEIGWPRGGRTDSDNAAPTVKALLDGLVDVGILSDDADEILHVRSFMRDPDNTRPTTHRVTLTIGDCFCPECRPHAGKRAD